ncbi:hypothetical protein [Streptosporangium canum]|nr:hypothetical protein [Streptosporangium canum]
MEAGAGAERKSTGAPDRRKKTSIGLISVAESARKRVKALKMSKAAKVPGTDPGCHGHEIMIGRPERTPTGHPIME